MVERHVLDGILRDWRWRRDPARAVRSANAVLDAILHEELPVDAKLDALEVAIEPMLDADGGSPARALLVVNAFAKEMQQRERTEPPTFEERMTRRVRVTVARARAAHCMGQHRQALEQCLAAYTAIETMADSRARLFTALGSRQENLIAELVDAVLGILAATLRLALSADHPSRILWTNEIRELAAGLLPGLDAASAPLYPRSASRVQVMFLLTEWGDRSAAHLVAALREFDIRARPPDPRAQATVPLREAAYAKFMGDAATLEKQATLALARLRAYPLPRHVKRVGGGGFF